MSLQPELLSGGGTWLTLMALSDRRLIKPNCSQPVARRHLLWNIGYADPDYWQSPETSAAQRNSVSLSDRLSFKLRNGNYFITLNQTPVWSGYWILRRPDWVHFLALVFLSPKPAQVFIIFISSVSIIFAKITWLRGLPASLPLEQQAVWIRAGLEVILYRCCLGLWGRVYNWKIW